MLIKKTKFKTELILLSCFFLLLCKALPTGGNSQVVTAEKEEKKQDEQTEQGLLVVEYVSGSESVLKKEVGNSQDAPLSFPSPKPSPTGTPEETLPTGIPAEPASEPSALPEGVLKVEEVVGKKYIWEDLRDLGYLKNKLYIVNASTKMTEEEFDVEYFVSRDLSLEKRQEPQILIFHTHGSEGFADSRTGEMSDTVVGAGELLAEILREQYGYQVLHDTTIFDRKNGKDNRNHAYNEALDHLEMLLKEYPSIEVVIDLHRDAGTKRVATINGKQTAKVMLFNGLCRNTQGKLTYLPNENLKDNLAFSFQMKLIGDELYPGLMNRIFLKDYRYNMHLKERYLLIELGTEQNTVEEAKNAMEPLADVLNQVLGG